MRHLKAGKRLGVTTSHRKALMRNLVTSLLEHGEIKTTITRAKEMRKYFDKMIGLGKKNNLHAHRQALAFVKSKEAIQKLFEEYGPLYADRNGGYTRIFRIGNRLGDNAQMALIQMVEMNEKKDKEDKSSKKVITEIKEELQSEEDNKLTATKEEKVVEEAKDDAADDTKEEAKADVVEAAAVEVTEKEDSKEDTTEDESTDDKEADKDKEEKASE